MKDIIWNFWNRIKPHQHDFEDIDNIKLKNKYKRQVLLVVQECKECKKRTNYRIYEDEYNLKN